MKRWDQEKSRRSAALFVLAALCLLLVSCRDNGKTILYGAGQINASEYSIGVPQSAAATTIVEEKFGKSRIQYFQSVADGYLAVKYGKIDAFAFDRHALQYVTINNQDLTLMDEKIGDEFIVVGSAFGREDLIKRVNAFITQYRADGTYQDMYRRWILGKNTRMPHVPEPKNPVMTLKIGTTGVNEPMNFYADGKLSGFDVEFSKRLALFLNAKCTFSTIEYPAIVAAAHSGKIDLLIANLNATPERRKMMLFSDTYVDSEISFLVRKDRLPTQAAGAGPITDLAQLAGKKVGVQTGTNYEMVLKDRLSRSIPMYFATFTDQIEAVRAGKIAGFLVEEVSMLDIMRRTSGLTYIKEWVCSEDYAFAFSPGQTELRRQVDAVLKVMRDDGTLKKLEAKWFGEDDAKKVLQEQKPEGQHGVIRFATDSGSPPFVYIKDGTLVGYDIEVATIVARKLGRKLEIMDMDFAAIIPSLISGKSDMAGAFITITEERAKSVLFSVPTLTGGAVVAVAAKAGSRESVSLDRIRSGFVKSFRRTFIAEDRYKLVLRGLWVTIVISILSAIFGTLLGFGVCVMRRARTGWTNIPAKIFIRGVQGTPIVVLLMILYYIVFGSVDVNAILVAVLGFSINFAAYVSEMMRTGIDAVDKGQHEAAYAIGFNRTQVFTRITFPQAARHVLPVFKGEFISMLKMTSVVGYIAVQDLTKISDIIRSRTYEAFFPLVATALIYFVIAYAMAFLLSLVEMRVDPSRRKRVVKGVVDR
ncbi:MAG: Octopine transport system permease protein OccM [Syntrophorhabdaceae bacterium PtaU1.Bin034]|nr:MAG: Octopine transport system permease protein OccM [Syntrophorhabdaceae bacterium PtaU1.Bin034]